MDQDLRRAPPCQLLLGSVLPAALWMWWKVGGCVPGAVHSVATQLFLLAPGGETGGPGGSSLLAAVSAVALTHSAEKSELFLLLPCA